MPNQLSPRKHTSRSSFSNHNSNLQLDTLLCNHSQSQEEPPPPNIIPNSNFQPLIPFGTSTNLVSRKQDSPTNQQPNFTSTLLTTSNWKHNTLSENNNHTSNPLTTKSIHQNHSYQHKQQQHSNNQFLNNSLQNNYITSMSTATTAELRPVPRPPTLPSHLPSALDHLEGLIKKWVHERRRVVFFLDYDGTLSPIVEDPDRAIIPQATRDALSVVASRFTTAIVSGRSLEKVMSMVSLNQLIYAGSHGFDIKGPKGQIAHRVASDFLPQLSAAKKDLHQLVDKFPGSSVEDNLLSISFHFRKVDSSLHQDIERCVKYIAENHGLVRTNGKMVHELRPLFDWHKGKAVEYLLQVLKLMGPEVIPIYIGDDVTDEDAFKVLNGRGISVIVADSSLSRNTYADMRLNDPIEVQSFLKHFAEDTTLSALCGTSE